MPVKLIIVNNRELGKISKEPARCSFDVWQTSLVNPKFAEFVQSCGVWGKQISQDSEVDKAIQELYAVEGPGVLEIITDIKLI